MEESFDLYKSYNTLIISQNKRSICALDRSTLQDITAQISDEQTIIPFLFILGLYKYEIRKNENIYYLVLVTKVERSDFFNICKIKSFEIVTLTKMQKTADSQKFRELLKLGLSHCSMYYSDNYNLTLTLSQQFENLPSRQCFVWNFEAINCLKKVWPNVINAKCFKEVIGGYFKKVSPFAIISRKSNKNGGCHTWNRGADINGNAANFVENEEIMILNENELNGDLSINQNRISAISHIEISGSCPFFWSQYPTMQLSRPFHFGPEEECERRFNLHFDHLSEIYGQGDEQSIEIEDNIRKNNRSEFPLIIVSLLNDRGKELKLNTNYEKLAKKRGIQFIKVNFNNLMKTKGALTNEIEKLTNLFDATVITDGRVDEKQTKIPRVNCSSCLDRTSVFMEILFKRIFQEMEPELFNNYVQIHKMLWLLRANTLSKEYAITRGQKTYMIETDYMTLTGKYSDYIIQMERFFYSIFYEGLYSDAYNAVLQERPFTKFEHTEVFRKIVLFLQLIIIFIYLFLFEGRRLAAQTWRERIKTIINHPHIPDLRDADEFDNIDFIQMKEKSQ